MKQQQQKTILITGGTTLVGKRLTRHLMRQGYEVLWLGGEASARGHQLPDVLPWDWERGVVSLEALERADAIIHLEGANLLDTRWTVERMRSIVRSRLVSAKVIFDALGKLADGKERTFICASSIYYYGVETSRDWLSEESEAGCDFLGQTFELLEERVAYWGKSAGVRTLALRQGFVLDELGGGLQNMLLPVRLHLITPLGKGNQYINWIHIEDLCRIYQEGIERPEMTGAYNACAVAPLTNDQFASALSIEQFGYLVPPIKLTIPRRVLHTVIGARAHYLLRGRPVSVDKLLDTGFQFRFNSLNQALRDLKLSSNF